MTPLPEATANEIPQAPAAPQGWVERWVDDPKRSVIAASVGTMSTLGIVLSGIWAINAALP
jgi:hypothetical protein